MKKSLLVVMFVISLSTLIFAQNFIEDQVNFIDGQIDHQINTWVQGDLTGKIGWFVWTLNSQYWSEGYPGITYTPFDWCQAGVGYGIETADDPNRYGSFLWVGKGRYSFIGFWEDGGSGYWHRMIGNISVKNFGLGVMTETVAGVGRRTGPRAEVTYKQARIWGTYMEDVSVVGFNFLF